MKKNILLGVLFFSYLGNTIAQETKIQYKPLNSKALTKSTKSTKPSNTQKALGFEFYHDNFDSIVGGPGLTTSLGTSSWTANNSGQAGGEFGWSVDAISDGWWSLPAAIASSSEGKFAEVSNGDPFSGTGTQVVGVNYTLTSAAIPVAFLSDTTNQISLSFEQYGASFNDVQQIFLSTNGTTWTMIGNNDDKEASFGNDANVYANPEIKVINLYPFLASNPDTIYLRFGWTTAFPGETDPGAWIGFGWYIDDIKLYTNPDSEVAVNEVFIGDIVTDFSYSQIPVNQVTDMVVGIALTNNGVNDMTAADVNISIKLNGTEVHNFNEPITLASAQSDTFWITSTYAPTTVGDYTVTVTLPADDILTNNTATSLVTKTTQYIFAHDYNGTTSEGFNKADEVAVANLFLMNNDQDVSGANIRFRSGTTVGQEVEVAIYALETSIQGTLDPQTVAYYEVKQSDLTSPTTIVRFPEPVTLSAGTTYMLSVKKSVGDSLRIATTITGDNDFSTAVYGPFGQNSAINYFSGWGWSPHIRLNFDPSLAIKNVSLLDGVKVYPNPSNGIITVSNDNGTQNTITVMDLTGKVVATRIANSSVEMDLNSFGSGVYMVEVANENGKKAERVVIK